MTTTLPAAEREKRRASLLSLLTVLFLIGVKVIVGWLTGSLGVLAQAADSILDLVATVLAFFAVRIAERPADAGHPYGHGKIENLAALAETGLLLATCGWIVFEAIQRLFFRAAPIESGAWGMAVMGLSIAASLWLSTYLMRVARRYRSQSLEGNALNFRTDVLSSAIVLLGLVLVWLSDQLGPGWGWLQKADALAALVVTALVLRVSVALGWRALNELLDAAPPGLVPRIIAETTSLPGVLAVGPVRVRQAGASIFVDLTIDVDRSASLEEAHQTATAVESRVGAIVGQGDVVVHVDPVQRRGESLPQAVSAIAARQGLRAHNIHAHEVHGAYVVDLHTEVPADLTLRQAHSQVSQLEDAIRRELDYVTDVQTHIEPSTVPAVPSVRDAQQERTLREAILSVIQEVQGLRDCHDVQIHPGPHGYDVTIHCFADPDLLVAKVHHLTDRAEKLLYARIEELNQVLLHVEPDPDNL